MRTFSRKQIEKAVDIPFLMQEIEKGLISYSKKQAVTAPISLLHFDAPVGDVHIKSGALLNDDFYVVKIASGFYDNPKIGLPSSDGLMLLFAQKTGQLKAILLDEGYLTDLRTALAGAICAKYLSNPPNKIGIIGTGTQARYQLHYLQFVTVCRDVLVWGRNREKAAEFAKEASLGAFKITAVETIDEITQSCNLIVTATTSSTPLLFGHQLLPGTHITAIGADDPGKQELDAGVFDCADLIIADSIAQCLKYGDLSRAKEIPSKPIVELGTFLEKPLQRSPEWITVADLTGIAVEDLQIAKAIYLKLAGEPSFLDLFTARKCLRFPTIL